MKPAFDTPGPRMILATAILLFGMSFRNPNGANSAAQLPPQSSDAAPAVGNAAQQTPSTTEKPAASPDSAQPGTKPSVGSQKKPGSTGKTVHNKKTVPASNCDPGQSNAATNANPGNTPDPKASDAQPATTSAPKKCPPPKIVVRKGGITEQSIQLAGGGNGNQEAQKRNTANQMLAATDANLKKIAELQLSQAQNDSVLQIRQFVDQSKSALASGDLERAQTLAWKAQLLSDDLLNPPK